MVVYILRVVVEQNTPHPLPEVTREDLLHIEVQKILDPLGHERWMKVSLDNQLLARAIDAEAKTLLSVVQAKKGSESLTNVEIIQIAIQVGTFVVQALANAFERERDELGQPSAPSSDGDDVGPQP